MDNVILESADVLASGLTYNLDDIYNLLLNISQTLNTVFGVILAIICIRFLWLLFDKWIFGGI